MLGESAETGGSANLEGIKSMEMQIWDGKNEGRIESASFGTACLVYRNLGQGADIMEGVERGWFFRIV